MDKAFRKQTPTFPPTGLHFKCEDGTDTNPVGPLYYVNGKQFTAVYVDTELEHPLDDKKFSPAWLTLREAQYIAQKENLPLEIF